MTFLLAGRYSAFAGNSSPFPLHAVSMQRKSFVHADVDRLSNEKRVMEPIKPWRAAQMKLGHTYSLVYFEKDVAHVSENPSHNGTM